MPLLYFFTKEMFCSSKVIKKTRGEGNPSKHLSLYMEGMKKRSIRVPVFPR